MGYSPLSHPVSTKNANSIHPEMFNGQLVCDGKFTGFFFNPPCPGLLVGTTFPGVCWNAWGLSSWSLDCVLNVRWWIRRLVIVLWGVGILGGVQVGTIQCCFQTQASSWKIQCIDYLLLIITLPHFTSTKIRDWCRMMPTGATLRNAYRARKGDHDADGPEHKVPQSFSFMAREGGG